MKIYIRTILFKHWGILLIIPIAIFFYTTRLYETYWFSSDVARDTLKALRILQNKEITLIGPPLSIGQYGIREIYFGSIHYYLGVLGLLLTRNNPLGPVYINTILLVTGIICFYLLARKYFKDSLRSYVFTALYAFSPLIVAYSRFYWNPNFILSIAPIFWLFYYNCFYERKNKHSFYALILGLLAALLINLHYFVIPIIILVFFKFVFFKDNRKTAFFLAGLLFGLLPLVFFELKHGFYLSSAFLYNMTHFQSFQSIYRTPIFIKTIDVFRALPIFSGLDFDKHYIPIPFVLPYYFRVFLGFIFIVLLIERVVLKKIKLEKDFLIYILVALTTTALLSQEEFLIRYFFITLPLMVLVLGKIIPKNKILYFFILLYFVFVSYRASTLSLHSRNETGTFPTIHKIEQVIDVIHSDKSKGIYNITENYIGDARGTYLRFFIERDKSIGQPLEENQYENIETLYVLAPNLEIVKKENRWEFYATPNMKLVKTFKIDNETYLYKYQKNKTKDVN